MLVNNDVKTETFSAFFQVLEVKLTVAIYMYVSVMPQALCASRDCLLLIQQGKDVFLLLDNTLMLKRQKMLQKHVMLSVAIKVRSSCVYYIPYKRDLLDIIIWYMWPELLMPFWCYSLMHEMRQDQGITIEAYGMIANSSALVVADICFI